MSNFKIEYLVLPNGKSPVIEWLDSLDSITRKRIIQRILRIEDGNFGDYKKLSEAISELRFTFGKGYRVYYTEENNKIILLINGGDKSKQSKDIEKAHELLEQWRQQND
jgi:putative addiction module killer protein